MDGQPIATYKEISEMDDSTFVKLFKETQLEQARILEVEKARNAIVAARDAELAVFDEDAKNQIGKLQSALSEARTVIENKYAALLNPSVVAEKTV